MLPTKHTFSRLLAGNTFCQASYPGLQPNRP
uniref:Uncharacterized protein n=1 Tax=Arundo donax TaxID=35708 RepID=A0A0A9BPA3_ARUDO